MNQVFVNKAKRVLLSRMQRAADLLTPAVDLDIFEQRPYELHLEFTNLCNANCVFCPYQFQKRDHEFMTQEVFEKAVHDYVQAGGGSVSLTPIVGDALIHPKFLSWVRYMRSLPQIDCITVTTNAILLNKHGVQEVLDSGINALYISTAGFQQEMYKRVYRNDSYKQFRNNVYSLYEQNSLRETPIPIFLCIRTDRPLDAILSDPDFQPLKKYSPFVDYVPTFRTAGQVIVELPPGMKLRNKQRKKVKPCGYTYAGPVVLEDGSVQVCACIASMDGNKDLNIGNLKEQSLVQIWTGPKLKQLRESFGTERLNPTCAKCDMYSPLKRRGRNARERAAISKRRAKGEIVRRGRPITTPFNVE